MEKHRQERSPGLSCFFSSQDQEPGTTATMDPQPAYDELIRRAHELATLGSCSALLGWDEQTYMPPGAANHRGSQMALLAGLHHERATDPTIGDLLEIVEGSSLVSDPESAAAVNIRELRRSYDRRVRLPKTLVEELRGQHRLHRENGSSRERPTTSLDFVPGWKRSSN